MVAIRYCWPRPMTQGFDKLSPQEREVVGRERDYDFAAATHLPARARPDVMQLPLRDEMTGAQAERTSRTGAVDEPAPVEGNGTTSG